MPKLHQCDTCRYCAHHYAIVCALHPGGLDDACADYEVDPALEGECFVDFLGLGVPAEIDGILNNPWHADPEENWAPDGWMYINGELVRRVALDMGRTNALLINDDDPNFRDYSLRFCPAASPLNATVLTS